MFRLAKSYVAYFVPLMTRLAKVLARLSDSISRIGQMQLIRLSLAYELSMLSKFRARQFSSALGALNRALLFEYAHKCRALRTSSSSVLAATDMLPSVFRGDDSESQLLFELSNFLDYNGRTDPLSKVYSRNGHRLSAVHLPLVVLLLVSSQMSKFVYVPQVAGLAQSAASLKASSGAESASLDGVPFVVGVATLLKQFHAEIGSQFFRLCSQFINASILATTLQ